MRSIVFVLLLALAPIAEPAVADEGQTNLNATDGSNPLIQYGSGATSSCGEFLGAVYGLAPGSHMKMQQSGREYFDNSYALMQWAMGFVTGINAVRAFQPPPRPVQIETDGAALSVWLATWCSDHPNAKVTDAVTGFVLGVGEQ